MIPPVAALTYAGLATLYSSLGPFIPQVRLVESPSCADRVPIRVLKSKKKRARQKFDKNPNNWELEPWKHAIRVGDTIYAHPLTAEEIRRTIRDMDTQRLP